MWYCGLISFYHVTKVLLAARLAKSYLIQEIIFFRTKGMFPRLLIFLVVLFLVQGEIHNIYLFAAFMLNVEYFSSHQSHNTFLHYQFVVLHHLICVHQCSKIMSHVYFWRPLVWGADSSCLATRGLRRRGTTALSVIGRETSLISLSLPTFSPSVFLLSHPCPFSVFHCHKTLSQIKKVVHTCSVA